MRIELEPLPVPGIDEDVIWQLAGFALSHCRLHIEFDDGDADGVAHTVVVRRAAPSPCFADGCRDPEVTGGWPAEGEVVS